MPGATPRCALIAFADVPADDAWLGAGERHAQEALKSAKRRAEWRAGRYAAKLAIGKLLDVPLEPARIEVFAASDGAPEVAIGGRSAGVSLSLAHAAGVAFAVAASAGVRLGCDTERVPARDDDLPIDHFAPAERARILAAPERERLRLATLTWSARESALKLLRTGLGADPRAVELTSIGPPSMEWSPLAVRLPGPSTAAGWWRIDGDLVRCCVHDGTLPPPAE